MSQSSERLRSILNELHGQLAQLDDVDPEVQQMLEGAMADIHHAMGAPPALGGAKPEEGSIVHRLAEAARHFEESHPTLSGTLGSAIDALSRMGI